MDSNYEKSFCSEFSVIPFNPKELLDQKNWNGIEDWVAEIILQRLRQRTGIAKFVSEGCTLENMGCLSSEEIIEKSIEWKFYDKTYFETFRNKKNGSYLCEKISKLEANVRIYKLLFLIYFFVTIVIIAVWVITELCLYLIPREPQ